MDLKKQLEAVQQAKLEMVRQVERPSKEIAAPDNRP